MMKNSSVQVEAKEYGIDISLLEANLERTPSERISIHQEVLETALLLREATKNAQHKETLTRSFRE